nr:Fur-regulated basic protein FbpB [Bacillus subtilis]
MPKRKVKTYQHLIQENKEAIMGNPKLMNVIYDRIDRKHQKNLQEQNNT